MEQSVTLSGDSFHSFLNQFDNTNKFWVAYSGGLDSSVLLHLCYLNKDKIEHDIGVIYVNHGLQQEADDWGLFCKEQCDKYDLSFDELKISSTCPEGESIEAWARDERYKIIKNHINNDHVVLMAHHLDDQVETFFLQALRGAGPRGLAAMPYISEKSGAIFARPLLNFTRKELHDYAEIHHLLWKEDKSNSDERFDRNYLRHNLIPVIEERWPAYRQTIERMIEHQKESRIILNQVAIDDINQAKYKEPNCLTIKTIKTLDHERQKNLLFFWLEHLGLQIPGSKQMERIIEDVIHSKNDKSPCVNWANVEIRRYKDYIYAIEASNENNIDNQIEWDGDSVINLYKETLVAKNSIGCGISKDKVNNTKFVIRFRSGGEKIKPFNSDHSKTVKQLFQERSVLPWCRDKIPLIYVNNELAMIPGFCVDNKFMAGKEEASWDIQWSGFDKVIQ